MSENLSTASAEKYEFERYFAEEDVARTEPRIWRVMVEDKPGNARSLGYLFANRTDAMITANGYNVDHETGFSAIADRFIDPSKQARWEHEQRRRKFKQAESRVKDLLKGMDEQTRFNNSANPGHAEQNNTQATMAYDNWATFGNSSQKNENEGSTVKIIKGRTNTGTIMIDPNRTIGFTVQDD